MRTSIIRMAQSISKSPLKLTDASAMLYPPLPYAHDGISRRASDRDPTQIVSKAAARPPPPAPGYAVAGGCLCESRCAHSVSCRCVVPTRRMQSSAGIGRSLIQSTSWGSCRSGRRIWIRCRQTRIPSLRARNWTPPRSKRCVLPLPFARIPAHREPDVR